MRVKRKRSPVPVIITLLLIAAVIVTGGFFGYGYYIRRTHPVKYENYVTHYAKENGLDKNLVYAVIKTESGFDPLAESNVGARGLMQIMDDTFEWLKYKQSDDDTEFDDMYEPESNIRYGCYLLGYLMDEFGNVETAMAAYHAGRGKVNEWLADKSISSDGVTLDTIPISDTAYYVDKITNAIKIYISLYGD